MTVLCPRLTLAYRDRVVLRLTSVYLDSVVFRLRSAYRDRVVFGLTSAYRDRVVFRLTSAYRDHVVYRLTSAYRDRVLHRKKDVGALVNRCHDLTRGRSLDDILRDTTIRHSSNMDDAETPVHENVPQITFPEFVRCIIKDDQLCSGNEECVLESNQYVLPMYLFCFPCHIEYDVILKVRHTAVQCVHDVILRIYKA